MASSRTPSIRRKQPRPGPRRSDEYFVVKENYLHEEHIKNYLLESSGVGLAFTWGPCELRIIRVTGDRLLTSPTRSKRPQE